MSNENAPGELPQLFMRQSDAIGWKGREVFLLAIQPGDKHDTAYVPATALEEAAAHRHGMELRHEGEMAVLRVECERLRVTKKEIRIELLEELANSFTNSAEQAFYIILANREREKD